MNNIFDFPDKLYCINLDSRKDRWAQASEEFLKVGIKDKVERISAKIDLDPRKGCLESHLLCISDAMENSYEKILIFEDDVYFFNYNTAFINRVINYLKRDCKWDLFYLGGNVMYPARFVCDNIFKSRFFSTHAYIVNNKSYEIILNSATVPIDKWYAMNTNSYDIYPIYATQRESYSDIRRKVIYNREDTFLNRYNLLVKPNLLMRWINYYILHYIKK